MLFLKARRAIHLMTRRGELEVPVMASGTSWDPPMSDPGEGKQYSEEGRLRGSMNITAQNLAVAVASCAGVFSCGLGGSANQRERELHSACDTWVPTWTAAK